MNNGMNVQGPDSDEWETPDWLFRALDTEFGFTLDPCATKDNAKCPVWFGKDIDGLHTLWDHSRIFVNPPYSNIEAWVHKAINEQCECTVMLLPVRTDNNWFGVLANAVSDEIRFYRKRIKFLENGIEMGSPRFPSMLAIIRPG